MVQGEMLNMFDILLIIYILYGPAISNIIRNFNNDK